MCKCSEWLWWRVWYEVDVMYEVLVKLRIRLVRNAVLIRDNVRWLYREVFLGGKERLSTVLFE